MKNKISSVRSNLPEPSVQPGVHLAGVYFYVSWEFTKKRR